MDDETLQAHYSATTRHKYNLTNTLKTRQGGGIIDTTVIICNYI